MSSELQRSALAPEIAVQTPSTVFVYEALVEIGPVQSRGTSPYGERRLVPILGGVFSRPRLRGIVLPGGADRQLVGFDGLLRLDALYELQTNDGAVITVRNRVIIDQGAKDSAYAHSTLILTAPEGPHGWLNRRIFVGTLDSLAPEPRVLIRVFSVE